ncbi:MAG: peptidoglycan DD-metalloendopeptidase family protein, partial [Tumebacillaceae bacterium]
MGKLTDVLYDGRHIATASHASKKSWMPSFDLSAFVDVAKKEIRKTFNLSNTIAAVAVLVLASVGAYTVQEKIAKTEAVYRVYIDGAYMGVVRDKALIDEQLQTLGSRVHATVEFAPVHQAVQVTSEVAVSEAIEDATKTMTNMVAIRVDGKDVVYVQDQAAANKLIQKLEDQYATKNGTVTLAEKVDFVPIKDDKTKITDFASAFALVKQGTQQKKTYVVSRGDSLWDIASRNKMTIDQLQAANPNIEHVDEIAEGQTINLTASKPLISVQTVALENREVTKNFETETRTDDSMSVGEKKVLQEGVMGKTQEVVRVTKKDGLTVKEDVVSSKVVTAPQKEIVVKGTRDDGYGPAQEATGDWGYPIAGGYVSGPYGEIREGSSKPHPGEDIAAAMGTPIYASNNGTVIQAGDAGDGYGNCVRIDHGNGVVTIYGHMSSIHVSVGQSVTKGEQIGGVGMTGWATGPHLHYEV